MFCLKFKTVPTLNTTARLTQDSALGRLTGPASTWHKSRTQRHCAEAARVNLKRQTAVNKVSHAAAHQNAWLRVYDATHARRLVFSSHACVQRLGLICGKCSPAGAECANAPSEQLFPIQILTPLCYNPAPYERLCPLLESFLVRILCSSSD